VLLLVVVVDEPCCCGDVLSVRLRLLLSVRGQAQEVLRGSGSLTPERKQYLDELRTQLSISQDKADKIIREVRRTGGMGAGGG